MWSTLPQIGSLRRSVSFKQAKENWARAKNPSCAHDLIHVSHTHTLHASAGGVKHVFLMSCDPRKTLVVRRKDGRGCTKVTGKPKELRESAAYPVDFGFAMVPLPSPYTHMSYGPIVSMLAIQVVAGRDRKGAGQRRMVV